MPSSLRCIVIGIPDAAFPEAFDRPEAVASIAFDELAKHMPFPASLELIVAPLFCMEFDALELIEILGKAGYRGQLRVVTPKLPNRQIVLRELRSHAVRQGIVLEMVEQTPS